MKEKGPVYTMFTPLVKWIISSITLHDPTENLNIFDLMSEDEYLEKNEMMIYR